MIRPVREWLSSVIPRAMFLSMQEGVAQDTTDMVARSPSTKLHDLKDFIYLDQRLPNLLTPWRARFAGRFFLVRNPLLGNDVLDLMMRVPTALRRGKMLYRHTVERLFPQVFRIRRARRGNYLFDFSREIRSQEEIIHTLIESTDSRLDDVVEPKVIHSLVAECAHAGLGSERFAMGAARLIAKAILMSKPVRRFVPPLAASRPKQGEFLRRVLILRCASAKGHRFESLRRQVLASETSDCIETIRQTPDLLTG
jgi:hypothetical protein